MAPLSQVFRVAIFDEFLDSFARLPRAQQKKVSRFLGKFRSDPTSSSINYEPINTFVDRRLHTVRIDDAYRAIILKPDQGNVYVLLWVDHHDEAMAWARHKRCVIHPETGSLQVLTSVPAVSASQGTEHIGVDARSPLAHGGRDWEEKARPHSQDNAPDTTYASIEPVDAVSTGPLFAAHSDTDLTGLGVPLELLAQVRGLETHAALEAFARLLPPEAYEALFFLSEGESLEDVRSALGVTAPQSVDPEDFAAALENPVTQRRFALVTDDQMLAAMFDAPLEKWRTFLHPSQRKLVRKTFAGPTRVLGGAGTGKTVVAMHRARYLAEEVFNGDDDRILFTTFTRNLAADIHANLRTLCPAAVVRRIEVVHLDKWVADFLNRSGYPYRLEYWPSPTLQPLWEEALTDAPPGFTAQFFREEWDYVIQPDGCSSFEDYRRAPRTGRGVRLSREQRKAIWKVFETYLNLLEERKLRESLDAVRDASILIERQGLPNSYRAIIVDEAQDMSTESFRLLRRMIPVEQPNDLFIVGDGHQRIYRRRVVLKQAGVNIVGRSHKLYINYRTTDEIRRFAVALLQGLEYEDLDGGQDKNRRYKSLVHGAPPEVKRLPTFEAELEAIIAFVKAGDISRTCLITRTNALLDQYDSALLQAGVPTYRLKRSEPEHHETPGLRLATMHRVKGLEFDRLIIAGVNDGVVPLRVGDMSSEDGAVREEAEMRERALFYVAVTRARREVLITCGGTPSLWVREGGATGPV